MSSSNLSKEINKRKTFAIISHPDAGKTTLTERLLHYGGAIQLAGNVRARKSDRYATSDWLELEKQRGISVTSSVMQFVFRDCVVNLLDTPGHADFSEDTYRTLTAVDSALMVLDNAKGVEDRTRKLMDICRMRSTPIISFINKLDRVGLDPIELLGDIEKQLSIECCPMTWPLGSGSDFVGVYRFYDDLVHIFRQYADNQDKPRLLPGIDNPELHRYLKVDIEPLREAVGLVREACREFSPKAFLQGKLTPVFFGSALNALGTEELLDRFVEHAPVPRDYQAIERRIGADEAKLTGVVFKIQANMDPAHHGRIAFLRIISGKFTKGMSIYHVRLGKQINISQPVVFLAAKRKHTEDACAGDVIGFPNHGNIRIGDTFTEGESLHVTGIPHFAPELFRRVQLDDPMRSKALHKGLQQLSEEGAVQYFRPLQSNALILGAVGMLQFDVVAFRLQAEYKVRCSFQPVALVTVRWLDCADRRTIALLEAKMGQYLALDGAGDLTYLAPNRAHLALSEERWPEVKFHPTKEVQSKSG